MLGMTQQLNNNKIQPCSHFRSACLLRLSLFKPGFIVFMYLLLFIFILKLNLFILIELFICLSQVLVAACWIFLVATCELLVGHVGSNQRLKLGPLQPECSVLATLLPGKSLPVFSKCFPTRYYFYADLCPNLKMKSHSKMEAEGICIKQRERLPALASRSSVQFSRSVVSNSL